MLYARVLEGVHNENKVTCEIAKVFVLRKHFNIFHFNNARVMKKRIKYNMRPAIQSNHRCNIMYKTATLP